MRQPLPRTYIRGVGVEIVRGSSSHSRAGRSVVRGKSHNQDITNGFRFPALGLH